MFSWKNKVKGKGTFDTVQSNPDRYLNLAKANNNKMKIIFLLLATNVLCLVILGASTIFRMKDVYIVEKEGNNYSFFGKVNDLTKEVYNPDDNSIIYFLHNLIRKNRALSKDLILYKNNRYEAGFFLGKAASKKLDKILTDDTYPAYIESGFTIDVDIVSSIRLSQQTLQVRWTEKIYKDGSLVHELFKVGVFKYSIQKPTSKEMILYNPLGLVITDLSITDEK